MKTSGPKEVAPAAIDAAVSDALPAVANAKAPVVSQGLPAVVLGRLRSAYPARSADIGGDTKAFGPPFVQRAGDGRVLSIHQKYALRDGTILVLEAQES